MTWTTIPHLAYLSQYTLFMHLKSYFWSLAYLIHQYVNSSYLQSAVFSSLFGSLAMLGKLLMFMHIFIHFWLSIRKNDIETKCVSNMNEGARCL